MGTSSEKVAVHAALLSMLKAGPYYAVTYDPSTGYAGAIDPSTAPSVTPSSVKANEVSASFEADRRHGRSYVRDRAAWSWTGIVKFDQEVTAAHAEDAWLATPTKVAASGGARQATIELTGATYHHPTTQEGYGGSLIEFTFEIRLSRR